MAVGFFAAVFTPMGTTTVGPKVPAECPPSAGVDIVSVAVIVVSAITITVVAITIIGIVCHQCCNLLC